MSENDEPFDLDDDEEIDLDDEGDLDGDGSDPDDDERNLDEDEEIDLDEEGDLDDDGIDLDDDAIDIDDRGVDLEDRAGLDDAAELSEAADVDDAVDEEPVDIDDAASLDEAELRALTRIPPTRADDAMLPPDVPHTPGPRNWNAKDLSDDKARARAIEEVLRDQARREVLREIAYRRPRASFRMRVAAGVLGAVAVIFWFFPLPFLRPSIPFPILPEDELAGLRFATYIQSQQLEAFRHSNGRLPDVLREAGEPIPGMSYERLDASTYRLRAYTERAQLQVKSDSIDAMILADSLRLPGVAR